VVIATLQVTSKTDEPDRQGLSLPIWLIGVLIGDAEENTGKDSVSLEGEEVEGIMLAPGISKENELGRT